MRRLGLVAALGLLLAGCGAAAPRAAPIPLPPGFLPSGIAFWSREAGILAGFAAGNGTVYLAETRDGGRTWRVRLRLREGAQSIENVAVAAAGARRDWLTVETCRGSGGYPDSGCSVHALGTVDGGEHWTAGGPRSLTFSFAGRQGWALMPYGPRLLGERLERLSADVRDPGVRATPVPSPCGRQTGGAEPYLAAVAALGNGGAALACAGTPAALPSAVEVQAKALFETRDGGSTWTRLAAVQAGPSDSAGLGVGTVAGLEMLPGGRGWLWSWRGGLYATRDGGRSWRPNPLVAQFGVTEALGVSFVDEHTGFALVQGAPRAPYLELMVTRDGGLTWSRVGAWNAKAAGTS